MRSAPDGQHADDFILQEAQPFGAMPSVPVAQELRLRGFAGFDEFALQKLRQRRSENVLMPGVHFGQGVDLAGDPGGIETVDAVSRV
jgi:hypothetical protein